MNARIDEDVTLSAEVDGPVVGSGTLILANESTQVGVIYLAVPCTEELLKTVHFVTSSRRRYSVNFLTCGARSVAFEMKGSKDLGVAE